MLIKIMYFGLKLRFYIALRTEGNAGFNIVALKPARLIPQISIYPTMRISALVYAIKLTHTCQQGKHHVSR